MSASRKTNSSRVGRSWGGLLDFFSVRNRRSEKHDRNRRLRIDPLEQRMLLSVSPVAPEQLVNQTNASQVTTFSGQSVAVNDNGDFVVVWTRNESAYDPDFGTYVSDSNVYARYFTDEVQRIVLPDTIIDPAHPNNPGYFSLIYGGNEIYKLTLSTANLENWDPSIPGVSDRSLPVEGTFRLGIDLNGDGSISSGELTTNIDFSETAWNSTTPENIKLAIQAVDPKLADVTVTAVSPTEYYINFGDASLGEHLLPQVINQNWTEGFLPSLTVSTVRKRTEVGLLSGNPKIYVSPTDPSLTATSIESAFAAVGISVSVTPVAVPNSNDPNGLRTFDITFIKDDGKTNQPLLVFDQFKDTGGTLFTGGGTVTTIKESSDEFRVNPAEPDLDYTIGIDKQNQSNAVVAMDADGDFVICWQSDVPDSVTPGSKIDIFAQRFSPAALTDASAGTFKVNMDLTDPTADAETTIYGVRPLGNAFQVNRFTTNEQYDPSVAMDYDGNFVVCWENNGQRVSFFNGVVAQRFDRDGNRLGDEFMVSREDTWQTAGGYVSVSPDGHFLITWAEPGLDASTLFAKVYDAQGQVITDQFIVEHGFNPTAAWDSGNHYTIIFDRIHWDVTNGDLDRDKIDTADKITIDGETYASGFTGGVYGIRYNLAGEEILPLFRVNDGTIELNGDRKNPEWPYYQGMNQVSMDADGDLYVTYEGYGPGQKGGNYDPNYNINSLLWFQEYSGASDTTLAQLNAAYQSQFRGLRGEGYGVMYTSFDTDPENGAVSTNATADNVVSTQLDGQNEKILIVLDKNAISGNLRVRFANGVNPSGVYKDINLSPVYFDNRGGIDIGETLDIWEERLNKETDKYFGNSKYPGSPYPVKVRYIGDLEMTQRENTYWKFQDLAGFNYDDTLGTVADQFLIIELTFTYQVHDWFVYADFTPGQDASMRKRDPANPESDIAALYPQIIYETMPDTGTPQANSSIAVQPDGSFVEVFTQYDRYSYGTTFFTPYGGTGMTGYETIYFREFNESTDTAGPLLTDFLLTDGSRLSNGGQVLQPLDYVIVTFDEAMMTTGVNSVTNTANWALLKDGLNINGGINKIYYGMNMAQSMGLSTTASNKYEAVLILDGNGNSTGIISLGNGSYQIVAKNSLMDRAGNPLNRTGYVPNGAVVVRSFDIALPASPTEVQVNSYSLDNQTTSEGAQA
ncbi:MAG: hypothetical protein ACWGMZ_02875, partial [Thermoguttaceae bacterium]